MKARYHLYVTSRGCEEWNEVAEPVYTNGTPSVKEACNYPVRTQELSYPTSTQHALMLSHSPQGTSANVIGWTPSRKMSAVDLGGKISRLTVAETGLDRVGASLLLN
jgi:hypothetical protein